MRNAGNDHFKMGDTVVSEKQAAGITAHTVTINNNGSENRASGPKRSPAMKRAGKAFGWLVGIAAIIGATIEVENRYWPKEKSVTPSVAPAPLPQLTPVLPPTPPPLPAPIERAVAVAAPKPTAPARRGHPTKERNAMSHDKNSTGDTVVSIGQSGGITAHTVTIDKVTVGTPPDPTPPQLEVGLARVSGTGDIAVVIEAKNLIPFRANYRVVTTDNRIVSGILMERPEFFPKEDRRRFLEKVDINRAIVAKGYIELRVDYESLYAAQLGNPPELRGHLVRRYTIDDHGVRPLDESHGP
jgi:hypothetical protein